MYKEEVKALIRAYKDSGERVCNADDFQRELQVRQQELKKLAHFYFSQKEKSGFESFVSVQMLAELLERHVLEEFYKKQVTDSLSV